MIRTDTVHTKQSLKININDSIRAQLVVYAQKRKMKALPIFEQNRFIFPFLIITYYINSDVSVDKEIQ